MPNANIKYRLIKPEETLADFVYCFSYMQDLAILNDSVVIPNGRIDLVFHKIDKNHFQVSLRGLETQPKLITKQSISTFFSISFNPLAVQYIFKHSLADILNSEKELSENFWDFSDNDFNDFDCFCKKASQKIQSLLPKEIDNRKQRLFALIYATNGKMSVKELSEKVFYSTRQINAYFNQQFGLSLKAYCNIIRLQASISHIKERQIFPQLNYYDQSHFIREVKRLSGASPKELVKNENSRFLQFLLANAK